MAKQVMPGPTGPGHLDIILSDVWGHSDYHHVITDHKLGLALWNLFTHHIIKSSSPNRLCWLYFTMTISFSPIHTHHAISFLKFHFPVQSHFSHSFLLYASLTLPFRICSNNSSLPEPYLSLSLFIMLVPPCLSALLSIRSPSLAHLKIFPPHTSSNLNANDSRSPWPFPSTIFLAAEFCMMEEKGSKGGEQGLLWWG